MEGTPDLAEMVKMIMGNPELMAQISTIASKSNPPKDEPRVEEKEDSPISQEPPRTEFRGDKKGNRSRLVSAMKPYLSENRARAIESMLVVADILDGMKRG